MLMAGQMHPPFLFWSCQKRNGPCTVQREKTLRRVGLRRRRPPAAGGGWLALPCRSQGRKRAALGETFGPGKFGIPSASLPAAAHAPTKSSQRQRKEKQLDATTTPTRPAPSATGRQLQTCRRPKRARRPGKIGAGTDTPTPVARRATAPERAQAIFSLPPGAAHSLFVKNKKRMGGAPLWEQPPAGAEISSQIIAST